MNCSDCASCPFSRDDRLCTSQTVGRSPDFCITANEPELLAKAKHEYDEPSLYKFAATAARLTASSYEDVPGIPGAHRATKPRIQEVAEFCQMMGYKKVGLAFCGAVQDEARKIEKMLREHYDLEVVSVMCKIGGVSKDYLGIGEEDKVNPGDKEFMCNPIAQAQVLNDAGTEFNLVMGLCVGHDSMFLKYSEAMCTVVAVKDRVLGHNPLAALYSSAYSYLFKRKKK